MKNEQIRIWMEKAADLLVSTFKRQAPRTHLEDWLMTFSQWFNVATREQKRALAKRIQMPMPQMEHMARVGNKYIPIEV